MKIKTVKDRRKRISLRQRKRINGTPERPRLRVFRSISHIYVQVIDDLSGTTLRVVGGLVTSVGCRCCTEWGSCRLRVRRRVR